MGDINQAARAGSLEHNAESTGSNTVNIEEHVQVELPREVLHRLLRQPSLVASEVRALNGSSRKATWHAVKDSVRSEAK